MTTRSFENAAVIFRQGDHAGAVYLVQSGSVQISQVVGGGEVVLLGLVGPQGIFGEMALTPATRRMATATAVGRTTCLAVGADALNKRLASLPPLARTAYDEMQAYIRGVVPFEARTPALQARGDTDADRRARALLERLPAVMDALAGAPPSVRAVFDVFSRYVRRRLPPR